MQGLCKEVLFLRNKYKGSRGWEAEDVDAWKETHVNMANNQVENDYPQLALRQMRSIRRQAVQSGNLAGRWTSDSSLKEDNSQD